MSLFGGETSAISESNLSRDTSPFPHSDSDPPQAAQVAVPSLIPSRNVNSDDDAYDNEDFELPDAPDASASSDHEPDRPNRFLGGPAKWRGYTAADRKVAASLEQVLSGDLAAHLYNAHAMKRRIRPESLPTLKEWHSKSRWYKEGGELWKERTSTKGDVELENFMPWKGWTAWPLPDPPRLEDRFGALRPDDMLEDWTIGGAHNKSPGDDLRDVLLGTFQRFAKVQWEARSSENTDVEDEADGETENEEDMIMKEESRSRSRSRSAAGRSERRSTLTQSRSRTRHKTQSGRETSQENSGENSEEGDFESTEVKIQSETDQSGASDGTSNRNNQSHYYRKYRTRDDVQVPPSRPVILADDEKARRILQPTINSLLSNLDDLLEGLRRSQEHQKRNPKSTLNEVGLDDISSLQTSPLGSRSRSTEPSSSRTHQYGDLPSSRLASDHDEGAEPKLSKHKRRWSRSSESNLRSSPESNSASEGLRDAGHSNQEELNSSRKRRHQKPSPNRVTTQRDWSQVLGLASMIGWDEAIIDRSAKRCSSLFGESMGFRTIREEDSLKSPADPLQYTPDLIFAPSPPKGSNGTAESSSRSSEPYPYFAPGTLRCPHVDCWGNHKEFVIHYRVIEHIRRAHGYDPRVMESSKERPMLGAVHEDGFLQPIHFQHGWKSRDGANTEPKVKQVARQRARRTSRR